MSANCCRDRRRPESVAILGSLTRGSIGFSGLLRRNSTCSRLLEAPFAKTCFQADFEANAKCRRNRQKSSRIPALRQMRLGRGHDWIICGRRCWSKNFVAELKRLASMRCSATGLLRASGRRFLLPGGRNRIMSTGSNSVRVPAGVRRSRRRRTRDALGCGSDLFLRRRFLLRLAL